MNISDRMVIIVAFLKRVSSMRKATMTIEAITENMESIIHTGLLR
jgi:hypothetical protein